MDGFHYTRAQLDAFSDPADAHYRRGAVDTFDANAWCALVKRLRRMDKGEVVSVPGFDHAVKDPEEGKLKVRGDCKIILLEGNYILVSPLRFLGGGTAHISGPRSYGANHGRPPLANSTSAYW